MACPSQRGRLTANTPHEAWRTAPSQSSLLTSTHSGPLGPRAGAGHSERALHPATPCGCDKHSAGIHAHVRGVLQPRPEGGRVVGETVPPVALQQLASLPMHGNKPAGQMFSVGQINPTFLTTTDPEPSVFKRESHIRGNKAKLISKQNLTKITVMKMVTSGSTLTCKSLLGSAGSLRSACAVSTTPLGAPRWAHGLAPLL